MKRGREEKKRGKEEGKRGIKERMRGPLREEGSRGEEDRTEYGGLMGVFQDGTFPVLGLKKQVYV